MNWIVRVWRGEYPLATHFWGFHVAGCVLYLVTIRLLFGLMAQRWANTLSSEGSATAITLMVGLGLFAVMAWSLTGLWRASARYGNWPRISARSWVFLAGGLAYAIFVVPLFL